MSVSQTVFGAAISNVAEGAEMVYRDRTVPQADTRADPGFLVGSSGSAVAHESH